MDEREALIAKITEEATKKAKSDKLNAAQTKLYVDEEVKKAVEEYDKKTKETKATTTQVQAIPTATTVNTVNNDATVSEKDTEKGTKEEVKKTTSKRYIVHTPVKNFCGEVAGVQFAYGKAEVKPGWILSWFKEHGYEIEEVSN